MIARRMSLWALAVCLSIPAAAFAQADPLDWPSWRGPEQNGISREKNLPDSWNPQGDSVVWQNEKLASRTTPIVMNGRLYTLCNDAPDTLQEAEKVVCADAATGEILWENKFNVFLSDVPNTRVGWSSVVGDPETGNVFALGVCGLFQCIDGSSGETLWSHSLSEEYGLLSTYGGRTNIPVVHEELVIISAVIIGWGEMAKPAHRFIAFDKRNGQPVWFEGTRLLPEDTTYSAPVTAVLNGQTALVFGSGDGGIHAFQVRTGKKLWSYDVSARGINTPPVVTADGTVICGHSEENVDSTTLGALFALDGNKSGDLMQNGGELWRNQGWTVGKTAPLIIGDRVYAVGDYGNFRVADLKTGEEVFTKKIGTQGRSSPLYADGKIYVFEANGRGYIFKPTEDGLEQVEAFRLRREEVHGSPIVSHGRLYLPTTKAMYCFAKPDAPVGMTDPQPELPTEIDDKADGPATLQIVPVEALLKPGQKQPFQVRLYSKNGLFIRPVPASDVTFEVDGPGTVDGGGKYVTDSEAGHYAATVTAKFGDLTGSARLRVVPDLPWNFDFQNGEVPVTWVGLRYRNVTVDFDFLQKLQAENPAAAQLYIYLQSDFVNNERKAVAYDNSTPRRTLSAMYIFMGVDDKVTSLDDAQKLLNGGLDKLVEEQFLANYEWSTDPQKGPTFKAARGARTDDGNIVMMKITTIPKGTRSQGWMGHPDDSQYTIQADVRAAEKQNRLPDIGVMAQRYRLEMLGASQQLKIYSWVSHEKKFHVVDFPWKSDVWYVMKFRADYQERDGKTVAVLQGKVWPRDEEEPAEWSIEWEDEPANTIGSPGLFGNAKDAEVFFDNIRVTPNE